MTLQFPPDAAASEVPRKPFSGADSVKGSDDYDTSSQTQQTQPQRMSDIAREQAIERAARLVEFFVAERACMEALYQRTSDLGHKGAADGAQLNAHEARRLMEALIRGRSPEYAAWLERQRGLDLPACANEEQQQ